MTPPTETQVNRRNMLMLRREFERMLRAYEAAREDDAKESLAVWQAEKLAEALAAVDEG